MRGIWRLLSESVVEAPPGVNEGPAMIFGVNIFMGWIMIN